jgi:hypothetical protein
LLPTGWTQKIRFYFVVILHTLAESPVVLFPQNRLRPAGWLVNEWTNAFREPIVSVLDQLFIAEQYAPSGEGW